MPPLPYIMVPSSCKVFTMFIKFSWTISLNILPNKTTQYFTITFHTYFMLLLYHLCPFLISLVHDTDLKTCNMGWSAMPSLRYYAGWFDLNLAQARNIWVDIIWRNAPIRFVFRQNCHAFSWLMTDIERPLTFYLD